MSADIVCPRCRRPIPVADDELGERVECTFCGTQVAVPPGSAPKVISPGPISTPRNAPPPVNDSEEKEAPLGRPPMEIDHEDLIDMTAMVDIVFFLLIFFLVTSLHALESSIPFPVPKPMADGAGGQPSLVPREEEDDLSIEVTIGSRDEVRVEGVLVDGDEDLLVRLRQLLRQPDQPRKMIVVGNGDASHGKAVSVIDVGYEAGFEKIGLAISAADSEQ